MESWLLLIKCYYPAKMLGEKNESSRLGTPIAFGSNSILLMNRIGPVKSVCQSIWLLSNVSLEPSPS